VYCFGISSVPPSFTFTPEAPSIGDSIEFISTDLNGTIIAWQWNFGDETSSNLQNPTHKYNNAGEYLVELIVTDNQGVITSTKQTIIVQESDEKGNSDLANNSLVWI
jgi:PKD repeat protein